MRVLAVGFLVALAACTVERADVRTPSGEPPEADTVRVREAIEEFGGALSGELDKLDTLFHDSATVYDDGTVYHGWAAFRSKKLVPEIQAFTERAVSFRVTKVRLADGTAWATFDYEVEAVHGGEELTSSGVGTGVLQKLGGRWWIVHVHRSAAPWRRAGTTSPRRASVRWR